jgi:hypothetical protein
MICPTSLIVISLRGNAYPRALGITAATFPADGLALGACHAFHHRPRISKLANPTRHPANP